MRRPVRAVCVMIFGCFGLMAPVSAQSADLSIGATATTAIALSIHADAPQWWSWRLPSTTGKLEANQPVEVLNELSYNTLIGQDTWFLVKKLCEDNATDDCTEPAGWVLGKDNGRPLLTPQAQ